MKDLILKYTLQNAVRYEGKANPGNVIGKILGVKPELKDQVSEVAKEANLAAKEVNKMSLEEQRSKLEKIAPELLDILRCPVSGQKLVQKNDTLVSIDGKHSYPIINGIPSLIPKGFRLSSRQ